jgi:ER lumen protein retaining receptor
VGCGEKGGRKNDALTFSKHTHTHTKKNTPSQAAPCLLVALFAHPGTHHPLPFRVAWAACVYMEAVSVLPQLRAMQKAKVVEKFTAHYVAALGLSRFISCAHWLLQIVDGRSFLLQAIGSGLWPVMVLLSEVVQTFILADFW